MAIENPASTPEDDDLRSALEAGWDELEQAPDTPEEPLAEPETQEAEESSAAERARDEKGRFTKAQKEAEEAAEQVEQAAQQEQKPVEEKPVEQEQPQAVRPPTSWSPTAKAAFEKADPAIREAVAKREAEVNQGFAKLAEYKGLDNYVEMARNSGTSLNEALDRYIAAENLLAQDFVGGVQNLCRMYGVHPVQLAQAFLGGQGNQTPQQPDTMAPVFQKVSALEAEVNRMNWERQQAEQQAINSQIDAFANDPANKYFDNVKETMGKLLNSGQAEDLKDAYEKACWINPEIRGLFIKEQQDAELRKQAQAVNKAKAASKSLPTGAPAMGIKPKAEAQTSIRGALEEAYDALGASI